MKFFLIFLLLTSCVVVLTARESDSLYIIPSDTLIQTETISNGDSIRVTDRTALADTTREALQELWSFFKQANQLLSPRRKRLLFQYDDLLLLNYFGLADIFRHQPDFQIYDLLRPGYPRFVAPINLLPHQSSLYWDGHLLNDPLHGMFNTHLMALDGVQQVLDSGPDAPVSKGTSFPSGWQLQSPSVDYPEPYTRIMFRQGDFGYSDLDISFAQSFSSNLALYLGGINKIYEGERNRAFQYRAALRYRFKPQIFSSATFNMDRERLILSNRSAFQTYRYHELRQDFNSDHYYVTDPQGKVFWHLQVGYTRVRRKNDSYTSPDTFLVRNRADQLNVALNRNFHLRNMEAIAAVSTFRRQIWGDAYNGKLTESGFNASLHLRSVQDSGWHWMAGLNSAYLYAQGRHFSPVFRAGYSKSRLFSVFSARREHRFPWRNERDFNYLQYHGNKNLNGEIVSTLSWESRWQIFKRWQLSLDLTHKRIDDEIRFDGQSFYNGGKRSFSYAMVKNEYALYKFILSTAGQITSARVNLSPQKSFSAQLRYHDAWLNGALIIDAIGNLHWFDRHRTLYYHAVVERFYWDHTHTDGYYIFTFKITATIKTAQLFMSMDNPQSTIYQYINGYYELTRRVQFGVNWVLWN